ncbi:Hypothetical predicted protein, partial [Pelobates cultripes]
NTEDDIPHTQHSVHPDCQKLEDPHSSFSLRNHNPNVCNGRLRTPYVEPNEHRETKPNHCRDVGKPHTKINNTYTKQHSLTRHKANLTEKNTANSDPD